MEETLLEHYRPENQRYRGLLLVISAPLFLVSFVIFVMAFALSSASGSLPSFFSLASGSLPFSFFPPSGSLPARFFFSPCHSSVVIFDAGRSGSSVRVFCFDRRLNLVPIGENLELFGQTELSLSAYAKDPEAYANSLLHLLRKAEAVVPQRLRGKTPVRLGATEGLRQLEGDASERILQPVRDFLEKKSSLKSKADWVAVLNGKQEGAYKWVTVNYLLGNLGKGYASTVGVVDLCGGSVQMAYAISGSDAVDAPKVSDGDTYVQKMYLNGTKYYLYAHSYLHHGLLAARAKILKAGVETGNPCILAGFDGSYRYEGKDYPSSALASGSSFSRCKSLAAEALNISKCPSMDCTFGGIWNGGRGDGQKNLFLASFFFDRAVEANFVDPNAAVAKVSPVYFYNAAQVACQTKLDDARFVYPRLEPNDLPYICMDLVYQFALLVTGFGLNPWQHITLVKMVKYQHFLVEAAWPLGSAIEAISSST